MLNGSCFGELLVNSPHQTTLNENFCLMTSFFINVAKSQLKPFANEDEHVHTGSIDECS